MTLSSAGIPPEPQVLQVRVFGDYFCFESLPGRPFKLDDAIVKSKREAADALFSRRHPLTNAKTVKKIKNQIEMNERKSGLVTQCVLSLGCIIPIGLCLGGVFDVDRDLVEVKHEVQHVLSTVFDSDTEYRLVEYMGDGMFKDGWVMFRVEFYNSHSS